MIKAFMIFALSSLLSLLSSASLAQRQLTTIEVHHAQPEQLAAAIMPYLSAGSVVNTYQNQLIVSVTATELETIQKLVKKLDVAGRALLISLRVGQTDNADRRGADVDIPPVIIDNNGIRTEQRTRVSVRQYSNSGGTEQTHSVRATEGSPALLSSGQTISLRQRQLVNGRAVVSDQLYPVESGFYATAWVNDDTVTIDIDQQNNQLEGGRVQTQQLQSRVSGPIDSWIPVGVITRQENGRSTSLRQYSTSAGNQNDQIFIRVELAQ